VENIRVAATHHIGHARPYPCGVENIRDATTHQIGDARPCPCRVENIRDATTHQSLTPPLSEPSGKHPGCQRRIASVTPPGCRSEWKTSELLEAFLTDNGSWEDSKNTLTAIAPALRLGLRQNSRKYRSGAHVGASQWVVAFAERAS
jgi:hypothetical protein